MKIGFFEMQEWEQEYVRPKLAGQEFWFFDKEGNPHPPLSASGLAISANFTGFVIQGPRVLLQGTFVHRQKRLLCSKTIC